LAVGSTRTDDGGGIFSWNFVDGAEKPASGECRGRWEVSVFRAIVGIVGRARSRRVISVKYAAVGAEIA
jgi:hypothetical protein